MEYDSISSGEAKKLHEGREAEVLLQQWLYKTSKKNSIWTRRTSCDGFEPKSNSKSAARDADVWSSKGLQRWRRSSTTSIESCERKCWRWRDGGFVFVRDKINSFRDASWSPAIGSSDGWFMAFQGYMSTDSHQQKASNQFLSEGAKWQVRRHSAVLLLHPQIR